MGSFDIIKRPCVCFIIRRNILGFIKKVGIWEFVMQLCTFGLKMYGKMEEFQHELECLPTVNPHFRISVAMSGCCLPERHSVQHGTRLTDVSESPVASVFKFIWPKLQPKISENLKLPKPPVER
jgi:hypothetical protein